MRPEFLDLSFKQTKQEREDKQKAFLQAEMSVPLTCVRGLPGTWPPGSGRGRRRCRRFPAGPRSWWRLHLELRALRILPGTGAPHPPPAGCHWGQGFHCKGLGLHPFHRRLLPLHSQTQHQHRGCFFLVEFQSAQEQVYLILLKSKYWGKKVTPLEITVLEMVTEVKLCKRSSYFILYFFL